MNGITKIVKRKQVGKIYEFCGDKKCCPTAVEAKIGNDSGLIVHDDFGGKVKLTDQNLKDLKNFLEKRFS